MTVFDRVVVGIDGTDFGFEALHQTLALVPPGASVLGGHHARYRRDSDALASRWSTTELSLLEDADRAREKATEILGDRAGLHDGSWYGQRSKSVLRHLYSEHTPGHSRADGPARVAFQFPPASPGLVVEVGEASKTPEWAPDLHDRLEIPRVHVPAVTRDVPSG